MSISNIRSYYDRFYSNGHTNHTSSHSTICGVIVNMRQQKIGKDKFINIITVDDSSARIQVTIFSEAYLKYKNLLTENKILFFSGEISIDDFERVPTI